MTVIRGFIKLASVFLALFLLFTVAFGTHVFAEDPESDGWKYIHDPSDNPEAMKDIVKDETAIYGFRPSETGSLKAYADAGWSDPDVVEKGRQERIAYHNSIESMYDILRQMQSEGKSVEEIARAVSTKRNELRMESNKDDPEGLETLKQRNLERYGHEEGPLPDELYAQYGSWETVIEKAFSANVGMDACLGLYDAYYDLYVVLGQVKDDSPSNPVYSVVGINGLNETGDWSKNTPDGMVITVKSGDTEDSSFEHFAGVKIDGNDLAKDVDYIVNGSTVVTLKAEALEKLAVGEHILTILFDNGSVETKLTVQAADYGDIAPPKTGDNSRIELWVLLMIVSGIALAALSSYSKKYVL